MHHYYTFQVSKQQFSSKNAQNSFYFSDVTSFDRVVIGVKDFNLLRSHRERVSSLTASLKWINVQAALLDICIAFHPLDLPPYVLLEIVDKFPFWSTHVNHNKKIDYIIRIKQFCDDLIEKRE
jgi:hypothetical protein